MNNVKFASLYDLWAWNAEQEYKVEISIRSN